MIGGAHGKILHINLTTGQTHIETPSDDFYRLLIGGRAVVAYLLLRDLPSHTDPLSPDNLLIFAPGLMQGTNLPGSGRHGVGGKSPLTGAIGSSEVGGWWGHEFKQTGFDALVISGRASSPVYLWIKDDQAEIRSADYLWGLQTAETQKAIRKELAGARVRIAQIGPAGENRVLYAAIMHDVNRAAGRNGLGALMGSKNLKAVAVRGTRQVPVKARGKVTMPARWLGENYKDLMGWLTAGIGQGTQGALVSQAYAGGLPTRNWRAPIFEHPETLSGDRNYEMFFKDRDTCHACPVRCKQVFENPNENPDRNLDPDYGGAEYESMGALGSLCCVEDNLAVLKASELANAYGLDTISTGASIAFAMECFEKGIITTQDTGGLDFRWGNGEVLVRAVHLIAKREGFGDLLAQGVARMSKVLGPNTEPFNLTVKGQELPMHEPRQKAGMGLAYALAPMGADHQVGVHDPDFASETRHLKRVNSALEKKIAPLPTFDLSEDKVRILHQQLNWTHLQDCALNCHFYCYDYEHLAAALSGVTGLSYGIHDLLAIGARAQTLARLFNLREGFTAADDRIPKRVMRAFDRGPLAGIEYSDEAFAWAIRRFYELMKWDPQTGAPSEECLRELEIDKLIQMGWK
jgi:aldehyde:ferredoxin oxidoreductase